MAKICKNSSSPVNPAASRSKRKDRIVVRSSRNLEKEVFGVLLLAAGLFIFLALITYHAADPSLNTIRTPLDPPNIANDTGLIGSYLSDLLLQLFGMSAFVIPLGFFTLGILLFLDEPPKINWARMLGLVFMTVMASALLRLQGPSLTFFDKTFPSGGMAGEISSFWIVKLFNRPGAFLVTGGAFLATLVAVTQLSIPKTLSAFLQIVVFIQIALIKTFLFLLRSFHRFFRFIWQKCSSFPENVLGLGNPLEATETNPDAISSEWMQEGVSENKLHAQEIHRAIDGDLGTLEPSDLKSPRNRKSSPDEGGPRIIKRGIQSTAHKRPKFQEKLSFETSAPNYCLPSTQLLHMQIDKPDQIDEWSLRMNSKILEKKLMDYGVEGKVVEIHPGPVITMYEFQPAPGVKVGKVVNLTDDLSLSMGGRSVRIVAPIPGKPVIGIEIPNHKREIVPLYEILEHESFIQSKGLALALGKDIEGEPIIANLAKMPHLLVAGATGTGKSVSINAMICSLLVKATPENVRFLMIDPKMVELPVYEGIPHLLLPVITNPKKSAAALKWAVLEMERRLKLLAQAGNRNIENFNKRVAELHAKGINPQKITEEGPGSNEEDAFSENEPKPILNRHGQLPYVVILIDELADLMLIAGREVEESITRLAQMARAVGIHLILATQRPSVDVITGLIKANFPARISFKVSSRVDSRTILDSMGSEHLLGDGDMLYMRPGTSLLQRIHGSFVTETEVGKMVNFLKKQGDPQYQESILEEAQEASENQETEEEEDELFDQAVEVVANSGQASVSYIQRRLRIGYNRAARIIECMEQKGLIGPADGYKSREIYISHSSLDGKSPSV